MIGVDGCDFDILPTSTGDNSRYIQLEDLLFHLEFHRQHNID